MSTTTSGLSSEEIEVFASGLYYLAARDQVDPREEALISEFLQETESELTLEEVRNMGFDPLDAAQVLRTTFLRHVFLKAAIALVRADGSYSSAERLALGEIADVFGVSNRTFGQLELEVCGAPLA